MPKLISMYSNPIDVFNKARQKLGNDIQIKLSTREDKKYMLYDPAKGKWIHFGEMGYEDYTLHNDSKRREAFLKRNRKWKHASQFTPAYLSYHLLW